MSLNVITLFCHYLNPVLILPHEMAAIWNKELTSSTGCECDVVIVLSWRLKKIIL